MNVNTNSYYLRTFDTSLDTQWMIDQASNFDSYFVKTYDVINQEISISITNLELLNHAKLYIDIYLVP
jgi:hypothetical protein